MLPPTTNRVRRQDRAVAVCVGSKHRPGPAPALHLADVADWPIVGHNVPKMQFTRRHHRAVFLYPNNICSALQPYAGPSGARCGPGRDERPVPEPAGLRMAGRAVAADVTHHPPQHDRSKDDPQHRLQSAAGISPPGMDLPVHHLLRSIPGWFCEHGHEISLPNALATLLPVRAQDAELTCPLLLHGCCSRATVWPVTCWYGQSR